MESQGASASHRAGLQVALLAVAWWSAAVVVTCGIKRYVSSVNGQPALFPWPFLFTALINLFVALWSSVCGACYSHAAAGRRAELAAARPRLKGAEAGILILIGSFQGLELAMVNKSYAYLSVSNNRMIMACCVVLQLFAAVAWGLETITCQKWVAAAMLVAGGVSHGMDCTSPSSAVLALVCGPHPPDPSGSTSDTVLGWLLVVGSVLLSCNRWAATQYIFQRMPPESALMRLTKAQQLPYMAGGTTLAGLLLSRVFEPGAAEDLMGAPGSILLAAAGVAVFVLIVILSELLIVSITAATIMVILAVVHNFPITLAGVLLFNDRVYRNQWIGLLLCTVGAAIYFEARGRAPRGDSRDTVAGDEARPSLPRGDGCDPFGIDEPFSNDVDAEMPACQSPAARGRASNDIELPHRDSAKQDGELQRRAPA